MNEIAANSLLDAETAFRVNFPGYEKTSLLDKLRRTTYARLDRFSAIIHEENRL